MQKLIPSLCFHCCRFSSAHFRVCLGGDRSVVRFVYRNSNKSQCQNPIRFKWLCQWNRKKNRESSRKSNLRRPPLTKSRKSTSISKENAEEKKRALPEDDFEDDNEESRASIHFDIDPVRIQCQSEEENFVRKANPKSYRYVRFFR